MKKFLRFCAYIICLLSLFTLQSCKDDDISLAALSDNIELNWGESVDIFKLSDDQVYIIPAMPDMWVSSSDSNIAKVINGTIQSVSVGTCKINFYKDKEGTELIKSVNVTVKPQMSIEMHVGDEINIKDIYPSYKYREYTIYTSDSNVVSGYDSFQRGTIFLTAESVGDAVIYVKYDYYTYEPKDVAIGIKVLP